MSVGGPGKRHVYLLITQTIAEWWWFISVKDDAFVSGRKNIALSETAESNKCFQNVLHHT